MDREAFGVLAQGGAGRRPEPDRPACRPMSSRPAVGRSAPRDEGGQPDARPDRTGVKNGRSPIAGASPYPSFAEPEALVERAEDHLDERGRDKILAGLRFGEPRDEARSRVR